MNAPARITVTVDRHGQPIVFGAHDTPRARANGCSVVDYVRVPPDDNPYACPNGHAFPRALAVRCDECLASVACEPIAAGARLHEALEATEGRLAALEDALARAHAGESTSRDTETVRAATMRALARRRGT
jgi:hypothetical protein